MSPVLLALAFQATSSLQTDLTARISTNVMIIRTIVAITASVPTNRVHLRVLALMDTPSQPLEMTLVSIQTSVFLVIPIRAISSIVHVQIQLLALIPVKTAI
jgi:hypothetical protein